MLAYFIPLFLALAQVSDGAYDEKDREAGPERVKVLAAIEAIESAQSDLNERIDALKRLYGLDTELESVQPLPALKSCSARMKVRTEDGATALENKDYERDKEDFHKAWEKEPESYVTNYNLALAYHRLGNLPLAKKMFKGALNLKDDVPHAALLRAYLEGRSYDPLSAADADQAKEEEALQNSLTNLHKEVKTYMRSKVMSRGQKMKAVASLLHDMRTQARDHDKVIQKHYLDLAETYAYFEMYDDALEVLDSYEASMKDKVLPDGYYTNRLKIEQGSKKQQDVLASYLQTNSEEGLRKKVQRAVEELAIFATQMDEFVSQTSVDDPDFSKLCQRLKEFRWSKRPNKHVIVTNKYEELLYSTLEGTLPLGRYEDTKGRKFLRNITQLSKKLELKDVEITKVQLRVNGASVPYLLLYTYVPKHEAFIIVRLPLGELS